MEFSENQRPIFSLNSKNPTFGPFPQFWGQNRFFHKIELSCTTSSGFLALCQTSEKSNDPIPRKHPDRCQEGMIDRPYFIGRFWLLPGDLTSTTAVDWHLKVGLTKNCVVVSMQKISSIHKFIQQNLGSHELNSHPHFGMCPPKNH